MSVLTKAQMEAVYQRNCDMIYRICLMHLKHEQMLWTRYQKQAVYIKQNHLEGSQYEAGTEGK